MYRVTFTFILVIVVVGCTSTPTSSTNIAESPIAIQPTVQQAATSQSSTEISVTQNPPSPAQYTIQEYPIPSGTHPHDVAPAPDGTVWYTAQRSGALGRLDPTTGKTRHIQLGSDSSPHGVIVGPDGAPWITDSGLNAIVRVDPQTENVQSFPLPSESGNANLNTAVFDRDGILVLCIAGKQLCRSH